MTVTVFVSGDLADSVQYYIIMSVPSRARRILNLAHAIAPPACLPEECSSSQSRVRDWITQLPQFESEESDNAGRRLLRTNADLRGETA